MVRLCYYTKDEIMTIDEHVKLNGKLSNECNATIVLVSYVEVWNLSIRFSKLFYVRCSCSCSEMG